MIIGNIKSFIENTLQKAINSEKVSLFIKHNTKLVVIKEFELEVFLGEGIKRAVTEGEFPRSRYLSRFKEKKVTIYQKIIYRRTFKKPFRFLNIKPCYNRNTEERFSSENAYEIANEYFTKSDNGKKTVKIIHGNKEYNLSFKPLSEKPQSENPHLPND